MDNELTKRFLDALKEYHSLGIAEQIDYQKFYLYSIITHSTAIEGSTVTEIENQLLFDEGITAKGRSLQEQMMNLDLKAAYERSMQLAHQHTDFSIEMLKELSAIVMKLHPCGTCPRQNKEHLPESHRTAVLRKRSRTGNYSSP